MRSVFRSLKHRNYRFYYSGQFISLHGTWMQTVAQAWLVYRLTDSSFMLGLVAFCSLAPVLLFSLIGGVAADRYSRRALLIAAHTVSMIQALVLATLTFGGWIEPWHIVVLSIVLGFVQAFEMPARHSFVTAMVPREDLSNAIALNASAFNAARFLGPSIAGWIVVFYGEGTVFMINAISFLAILFALMSMRSLRESVMPTGGSIHRRLLEGIKFAWYTVRIRAGLLMIALISLVAASVTVLMPVFAKETFGGGPQTLGILLTSVGIGALGGALRLAYRRSSDGLESTIGMSSAGVGLSVLFFSVTDTLWFAIVILIIAGFVHTTTAASINTLIQLSTQDSVRGRVMSLFSTVFIGLMPIGSLLSGIFAGPLGASGTVALFGSLALIGALAYLRFTRNRQA